MSIRNSLDDDQIGEEMARGLDNAFNPRARGPEDPFDPTEGRATTGGRAQTSDGERGCFPLTMKMVLPTMKITTTMKKKINGNQEYTGQLVKALITSTSMNMPETRSHRNGRQECNVNKEDRWEQQGNRTQRTREQQEELLL